MTVGIYLLRFNGTDKVYIGKSINLETRLRSHIIAIKAGKGSKKLSEAFTTYGIPTMEILLECTEEELSSAENETIDIYNAVDNGFNSLYTSDEVPYCDNTGDKNGMSEYSNEDIRDAFKYMLANKAKSLVDISKDLGMSYNVLNAMSSCTNHTWLEKEFPEEYTELRSLVGTRKRSKSAEDRGIKYPDIISAAGEVYSVSNIRQFAEKNGMDRGGLCKLLNGKIKSVKGWKLA